MVNAPTQTLAPPRRALVGAARPQVAVMSGQLVAGLGNLIYAVALAHLLDPGDYSKVVAFLAVYILMHVPSAALSAAGALAPQRAERLSAPVGAAGLAMGVLIVLASAPLGRLASLDQSLVVALGVAAPSAALLGLRRGVAYGRERLGRVTASLVVDPAVRLGIGVVLAIVAGPIGAAVGAVLAGYAALAVCATAPRRAPVAARRQIVTTPDGQWGRVGTGTSVKTVTVDDDFGAEVGEALVADRSPAAEGVERGRALALRFVCGSFVLMAILQSIDLLVANRVLDGDGPAQFAVLSTLGGAAFFATATIPLVLMPAAVRGRQHAGSAALVLTVGVGTTIALLGAIAARPLLRLTFGNEYAVVAHLVGPYLLAMALLGVVRVEVARRAADRDPKAVRAMAVTIGIAVAVEVVGLVAFADHVGAVVAVTLVTATGLAAVVELQPVLRARARRVALVRAAAIPVIRTARSRLDPRAVWAMVGLCVVATAVRVATSRGLWVDEAISVSQAQMSFGQMLADVRDTDVHPPLHHALLWLTVRAFGTSEVAVRLPSLIAGVALVPVMAWVGRVLYDRRTGWIAAVLAAIAPFGVWYSQEARMYSLFMLFSAVAVGAQVQAVRTGRTRHWVLYGLATAALIWTQYFALLPVLVQQLAFGWVYWRYRRNPTRRWPLVNGWLISTAVIAVSLLPMVPFLRDQLVAYGGRGTGLTPGQAGAGSSVFGGTISIYAVGANLVWATLGYHADGVMIQIAALWPLLMLLALVMLGRGRTGRSVLLLGLVVVPMAALFVIGAMRRDLFELRYFSGAVPAMLLLGARVMTSTTVRRGPLLVCSAVVVAALGVGLVDQQLNGANPRLYDFEGAFEEISARAGPGDVVLYEPSYLAEVVEYYAPDLEARPVGSSLDADTGTVFVLATERVINVEDTSARLGAQLAGLEQDRDIVDIFERPNVRVWELQ